MQTQAQTQSSATAVNSAAPANGFVTFFIVAGSSIFFCSKGVVAKLAYAQGADALTVLTLRMVFALPFFIGITICSSRGRTPLTFGALAGLAGLGFIGYYMSALINFTGLQYVSVGLERIILYTYPTFLLAFSRFVLQKPVSVSVWLACLGAWMGIVAAFTGELHNPSPGGRTLYGGMLIFASAMTYAFFLMLSGSSIRRVGAMRFTGIVMGFSCIFTIAHYAVIHPV